MFVSLDAEATPEASTRLVLQATMLSNCPLHRVGERLWVDPPQILSNGTPVCVVPIQKACSPQLGAAEGHLQCRWKGCEGRWSLKRSPQEENIDLERIRDDDGRPFLLQMPQAIAASLINAGTDREIPAGTRILEAGVPNDELFLMRDGEVEVLEEREAGIVRIATIRRGDCFGEMSLLAPHPSSNAVRAVSDVRLIAVPKARFYEQLGRYPFLGLMFTRLLAKRLRASNRQLEQILRPGLWGKLELFHFTSVIESIHQGRMTGILTITRPRGRAVFGFEDGKLRHASTGTQVGEDVLVEVLRWTDGVFRFQDEPLHLGANMRGDTMAMLFDAVRRYDELERDVLDPTQVLADDANPESIQTLADTSMSLFEDDEVNPSRDG
jgi:CRP-like cAMP-binding protein